MKIHDILEESLISKIKSALGSVKGRVVGSVTTLLQHFKKSPSEQLTTIEKFKVKQTGQEYISRVDTGALVCAIHATDITVDLKNKRVTFKHEGKSYDEPLLRMKTASNANGVVDRPRVSWTYEWNGKQYSNIETSLSDRSKLKFKLLIGRNLIKELKLPVHISDQEISD